MAGPTEVEKMRLLAVSDLHVRQPHNRQFVEAIRRLGLLLQVVQFPSEKAK